MFSKRLVRLASLAAIVTCITAGGVLAADNAITIGPSIVPVQAKGYNYRFAINVTCTESAEAAPCDGLLSITTAPIKPYSSIAKKTWVVGALPFSIPAGQTAPVRGRLLAGALVQIRNTGKLRVLVKIVRDEVVVGSKTLTLKVKK